MPRLTSEQVRQLRELAGMPDAEASVEVLLAAVTARLAERNRQLASPARRDATIEAAIGAGKFTEARREHYRRLWDQDPQNAEATIASLAAPPVSGVVAAAANPVVDDEWAHLFPPDTSARGDFRPRDPADRAYVTFGLSQRELWAAQDRASEPYSRWLEATEAYRANPPHTEAEFAEMHAASGRLTKAEWVALFGDDRGFE